MQDAFSICYKCVKFIGLAVISIYWFSALVVIYALF